MSPGSDALAMHGINPNTDLEVRKLGMYHEVGCPLTPNETALEHGDIFQDLSLRIEIGLGSRHPSNSYTHHSDITNSIPSLA